MSDLERGLYQTPHRDTVGRLTAALGLSPERAAQLEALVVRQRGPTTGQPPSADRTARLPTGIVTFLASSFDAPDRSEQLPIERLQHWVERSGGTLVRSRDLPAGLLAVFTTASAAATAAADMQRALADSSDTQLPRPRIALHTGEADIRDGEYYGSALSRSLRLCSMAVAGQTLVSNAASELIRGSLPSGTELRDLGEHHIGGVMRPERVFQLLIPGVTTEFASPSLASMLARQCDTVVRALIDRRLVFFIGQALTPAGRALGERREPGDAHSAPDAQELATRLAQSFAYPRDAPHDLVRVAQYVSTMAGSGPLYESLHGLLDSDYRPTALHELLAGLRRTLADKGHPERFPLIVTTCYDDSLERAFRAVDEPFDLVTYVAEGEQRGQFVHRPAEGRPRLIDRPNKYLGLSDRQTVILKVHGAVDRANPENDSFVITEDHFLDYLTSADLSSLIPVTVAARLRKSHFLFLGYDLGDWNLRIILRRLWGEQRLRYKSWAIHSAPPEQLERELWRTRDVEVLDVQLQDYLAELRTRLNALPMLTAEHG